jgi:hypothetical protein
VAVIGTVRNALLASDGRALQNVPVSIKLIAPLNPFLLNGIGEVLQRVTVDTGTTGIWSAELLANSEFEQENTYYLVDETCAPDGGRWAIRMPDGGSYELRDLLIYIPPEDNPGGPVVVGGGSYVHTQASPATPWVIDHRLGYPPNIDVLGNLDPLSPADWIGWNTRTDPTPDRTVLTYLSPVSGRAVCS